MKILYDHQIFSDQNYGGISKYFIELIKNLPSEHQFNLSLLFSENYYLKENYSLFKKTNILPDRDFKGKYTLSRINYSLNQIYSRYLISKGDFVMFHPTFYDDYFFKVLKKPYIITVHDLIAFKYNYSSIKSDRIRSQMERVIRNANRIIAISENTRKDLVDILKINAEKIDVIYHGYNEIIPPPKKVNSGKYLLFVGRRGYYKNFKKLAEAASILFQREKDLFLMCVGSPFSKEEMEFLTRLEIEKRTFAMNTDSNTLNHLYSNALVFVFPSLYEGFGMPILEAFANNCPVCLSDSSSFPEVAGDAAVYFNPENSESILAAVEKVIYDPVFAEELVNTGKLRLKNFSWSKASQETLNSYRLTL